MSTLSDQDLKKYGEHFSLFDIDSDGNLDIDGLGTCLRSLGFIVSNEELYKISQSKSQFSFSDMLALTATLSRINMSDQEQVKELQEAFASIDTEGKGIISVARLKEILANVGETLSEEEIDKLESRFDSKEVDVDTFVGVLMSKR